MCLGSADHAASTRTTPSERAGSGVEDDPMSAPTMVRTCRAGGGTTLIPVLDLGEQALTGVFPKSPDEPITTGPLRLVWCPESVLLQLSHSYDLAEMYGDNYGYRSGLNQSMVRHLALKIRELERFAGVA